MSNSTSRSSRGVNARTARTATNRLATTSIDSSPVLHKEALCSHILVGHTFKNVVIGKDIQTPSLVLFGKVRITNGVRQSTLPVLDEVILRHNPELSRSQFFLMQVKPLSVVASNTLDISRVRKIRTPLSILCTKSKRLGADTLILGRKAISLIKQTTLSGLFDHIHIAKGFGKSLALSLDLGNSRHLSVVTTLSSLSDSLKKRSDCFN